ncbi:MAG: GNAT family N-acetyltransferase [Gemmatimonadaceae bacterium]
MVVTRATPADARRLAEFASRTFRDTFEADNTPEDLARYLSTAYGEVQQRAEIETPGHLVLVAESGGALAGYAHLRCGPAPECVAERDAVELWRFYVDREWHGQGVAAQLMQETLGNARERQAPALWLSVWEHNPRAQRFYGKCGFRHVGNKPFVVGSDVQTDWVMTLTLS